MAGLILQDGKINLNTTVNQPGPLPGLQQDDSGWPSMGTQQVENRKPMCSPEKKNVKINLKIICVLAAGEMKRHW